MRWIVALAGAIWAALLIAICVPYAIGSVLKTAAFPVITVINRGEIPTTAGLDGAARSLDTAALWDDGARVRTDLGLVLLMRAGIAENSVPERTRLNELAREALLAGLARAPVRPHSWVRLASLRMAQTGPSAEIVALLQRSVEIGRFVTDITLARVELLLLNWAELPTGLRIEAAAEFRRAWALDERALAVTAQRTGQAHIVQFALDGVPGARISFDRALRRGAD